MRTFVICTCNNEPFLKLNHVPDVILHFHNYSRRIFLLSCDQCMRPSCNHVYNVLQVLALVINFPKNLVTHRMHGCLLTTTSAWVSFVAWCREGARGAGRCFDDCRVYVSQNSLMEKGECSKDEGEKNREKRRALDWAWHHLYEINLTVLMDLTHRV